MEEIILEFEYEGDDLTDALQDHLKFGQLNFYFWLTLLLSIFGVLIVMFSEMFIFGYTIALVFGLWSYLYYISYYVNPRRHFERNKHIYSRKQNFSFSDEGIYCSTDYTQSHIDWKQFQFVRETPEFFLLYQDADYINIIPKRVFGDKHNEMEFEELLRRKIANYAELQGIFENKEKKKKEKYLPPETPPDWR